jgi:hypothetical protein
MPCPLCAAIREGMPVTDDTPLPCRLRPDAHEPDAEDPFHGAVFSPPPGKRDFDESFVEQLRKHQESTTPAERVAAHAAHLQRATAFTASRSPSPILAEHPLDALTRKDT